MKFSAVLAVVTLWVLNVLTVAQVTITQLSRPTRIIITGQISTSCCSKSTSVEISASEFESANALIAKDRLRQLNFHLFFFMP